MNKTEICASRTLAVGLKAQQLVANLNLPFQKLENGALVCACKSEVLCQFPKEGTKEGLTINGVLKNFCGAVDEPAVVQPGALVLGLRVERLAGKLEFCRHDGRRIEQ